MSIELVLFDFGGVLAEEGFMAGLEVIAEKHDMQPAVVFEQARDIIFNSGFVVGKCDEATFWKDIRNRIGVRGSDKELRAEVLVRFVPRPWMFDLVRQLKRTGIRVAILSDQVNWLKELDRKYHFFQEFEKVFNSFDYGTHKGEERFFRLALEELGVAPENTLFVDDAVKNIAVATSLGLRTILYTDQQSFMRQLQTFF